jgi:hypothetical protein
MYKNFGELLKKLNFLQTALVKGILKLSAKERVTRCLVILHIAKLVPHDFATDGVTYNYRCLYWYRGLTVLLSQH